MTRPPEKPTRIEKLTAEQTALMPVIRDEWLHYGLCTARADRATAVAGVAAAYREAGLEPPRIVVWLDSPMAGVIGSWMVSKLDGARDQVWAQVRDQVRAQVWDQVRDQVSRAAWGQHDYWLSWTDYFRRACDLTVCDRLNGLNQIAQSAGWWWPFRGAVVFTERPTQLHRDGQGRLHHETQAALLYPDGWGIWAWHGVRVPQALIETGWSTQDILTEPNAEIRRCAIERLGWDRFVSDAGLCQIGGDEPDPGNPGHYLSLYDVPEQIYNEPIRVLIATNGTVERDGTRRTFGLTVPADIADPLAAAAWTYALTASEYAQAEVRR